MTILICNEMCIVWVYPPIKSRSAPKEFWCSFDGSGQHPLLWTWRSMKKL